MYTVVVLTHDNSQTIDTLLTQLVSLPHSPRILVIDDDSSDDTRERAQSRGATVIQRTLSGDYAAARNFAMHEATTDWLLYIDSDELLDEECIRSLRDLHLAHSVYAAYRICRYDRFWGRVITHGELSSAAHTGIIRLVHRMRGEWRGVVHEVFVPTGPVGTLAGHLEHTAHRGISDFLASINRYSDLRARELLPRSSRPLVLIQMCAYPPLKFVYTYIIRLGILDGAAGFVYSFMMSFHSYLVRAKLLASARV